MWCLTFSNQSEDKLKCKKKKPDKVVAGHAFGISFKHRF